MSTPNCNDFCTAAECFELRQEIEYLKFQLDGVLLLLNEHIAQDIPEAHNYNPEEQEAFVTVDIFPQNTNEFIIKVGVNGEFDEDILIVEESEPLDFYLTLGLNSLNEIEANWQYGEQFNSTSTPLPNLDVAVGVFEISDNSAAITVQVGESRDEDILVFPQPETTEHTPSNLSLGGSFINNILTITVADGESADTEQIPIYINNDGGGSGLSSCDGFSQELQDCCSEILAAINNNFTKIQEVENYLTIDISGTVCSDYKSEFQKDEDDQIIPTYAEATLVETEFAGIGIQGINERLKLLAVNQDSIFKELVKAVPPPINIPMEQTLQQICADNRLLTQADFEDEQGFFDYLTGEIQELVGDSILSALIKKLRFIPTKGNAALAVTTTLSWGIGWLIEQMRGEQMQSTAVICEGIAEPQDIVTLVASEKELHRIDGEILIIQFVTLDNYPKRSRNSSYRPIHVPAPKEEYDWNTDFKDLRWQQGNQYAELVLEGYKHGVSGWFEHQEAADVFFDAVLNLTTATETNRLYPKHKTPKTAYIVRPSRPWRAFISRQNDNGEPETLFKYFPGPDEETN